MVAKVAKVAPVVPAEMPKGTISWGTLRAQDVLPALVEFARAYAPAALAVVPAGVAGKHHDDPWWDGWEVSDVIVGLMDALSGCAPTGYYVGSHPGDGSDIGVWPVEDNDWEQSE
jgi:hypothetical protein